MEQSSDYVVASFIQNVLRLDVKWEVSVELRQFTLEVICEDIVPFFCNIAILDDPCFIWLHWHMNPKGRLEGCWKSYIKLPFSFPEDVPCKEMLIPPLAYNGGIKSNTGTYLFWGFQQSGRIGRQCGVQAIGIHCQVVVL